MVRGSFVHLHIKVAFGVTESPSLTFLTVNLCLLLTEIGGEQALPIPTPPRRGEAVMEPTALAPAPTPPQYDSYPHHYRRKPANEPLCQRSHFLACALLSLGPLPTPPFQSSITNQHPDNVRQKPPVSETCGAEGRNLKVSKLSHPGLAVRRSGWVGLSFP